MRRHANDVRGFALARGKGAHRGQAGGHQLAAHGHYFGRVGAWGAYAPALLPPSDGRRSRALSWIHEQFPRTFSLNALCIQYNTRINTSLLIIAIYSYEYASSELRAQVAYGSTELSPLTTLSLGTDSVEERACSVGFPSEHVEVRVAHTQSRKTVPIGEAGELCVRGYNVMRGYWEEPAYVPSEHL